MAAPTGKVGVAGGNRSLSESTWVTFARSPDRLETGGVTRGGPRCPIGGEGVLSRPGSGGGVGLFWRGFVFERRSASERLCVIFARSPERLEMGGDTRGGPGSGDEDEDEDDDEDDDDDGAGAEVMMAAAGPASSAAPSAGATTRERATVPAGGPDGVRN